MPRPRTSHPRTPLRRMPRPGLDRNTRASTSVVAVAGLACAAAVVFVVVGFDARAHGTSSPRPWNLAAVSAAAVGPAAGTATIQPDLGRATASATATTESLTIFDIVADAQADEAGNSGNARNASSSGEANTNPWSSGSAGTGRSGTDARDAGHRTSVPRGVLRLPPREARVIAEPADDSDGQATGLPPECERYRDLVQEAGDWDPDIALAFIWRESLCNERAVSPTNDWGLLQINATCWAGTGIDRLGAVRQVPKQIENIPMSCDGATQASRAAKWCFHAKEQAQQGSKRPASPCDAWLDPATNLAVAYDIWQVQGWQAWCFDRTSESTPACSAAAASQS